MKADHFSVDVAFVQMLHVPYNDQRK